MVSPTGQLTKARRLALSASPVAATHATVVETGARTEKGPYRVLFLYQLDLMKEEISR